MDKQRIRRPWVGMLLVALAAAGAWTWPALVAQAADSTQATTPTAPTALQAPSTGSTVPSAPTAIVPEELLGLQGGKAEPPSTRPSARPTPRAQGSLTFIGELPKKADIDGMHAWGKGAVEIEGSASVRVAGQGTLWIDHSSSVTQDAATTCTISFEPEARKLDRFSGSILVFGDKLKLRFEGERIYAAANGAGKVTMKGSGFFRMATPKRELVSGLWSTEGVTQEFKSIGNAMPTIARKTERLGPKEGILPLAPPPDARTSPPPKLPSEGGRETTMTVRITLPPASAVAPGVSALPSATVLNTGTTSVLPPAAGTTASAATTATP